jgi:cytidylate kinase
VIIAIDGPSGAGKGTVAAYLAEKYNLRKLDTGLLYRALAVRMLEQGIPFSDEPLILELAQEITLEDTFQEGLKTETVAALASKIAVIPSVRDILNRLQRNFIKGEHEGYDGIVLDGRDIGTVICPDADLKIYLTASQGVRTLRRLKQEEVVMEGPLAAMMMERDQRDSSRKEAPLNVAKDAIVIDTSHLSIDEVCLKVSHYIEKLKKTSLS